jgi:hypothetical protein
MFLLVRAFEKIRKKTDGLFILISGSINFSQRHSIFTVQILYNLYRLQLNCTYINYIQAATKYSAAHQNSAFILQILYKP